VQVAGYSSDAAVGFVHAGALLPTHKAWRAPPKRNLTRDVQPTNSSLNNWKPAQADKIFDKMAKN